MKTLVIVGAVLLAIGLVAAGAWAGMAWAQDRGERNPVDCGAPGYGIMGPSTMGDSGTACGYGTLGSRMMGSDMNSDEMPCDSAQDMPCDSAQDMPCDSAQDMPSGSAQDMTCGEAYTTPGDGKIASLEEVEAVVHDYVGRLGYTGMEVTEVMEFERNYYAIVAEQDTGIGAMELLVDKDSGAVGPEPGPNMMWNAKYGMMGRRGGMMGMMGSYGSGEMTLSPQEAEEVAQRWLDTNLPGRTPGEADEFYGYYTLHFLNDGQIEGMLSVHGSSEDVWYHSWHGDFVTMTEEHG